MDRSEKIQSQLYENQMQVNKSFENKTINVLVENFTDDKITKSPLENPWLLAVTTAGLAWVIPEIVTSVSVILSPLLGNNCRYLPTCSDYFIDSLKEFGFFKGIFKGSKRILSCHPFKLLGGGQGFDPIKKRK